MNATQPPISITPVANAGILVHGPGPDGAPRKILVDALCHTHGPFDGTPPDTVRDILEGAAPFDGLDALCFTHEHRDHFHADLAAEFCRRRPDVPVIANPRAAGAVRKRLPGPPALLEAAPALFAGRNLDIPGLPVSIVSLRHGGEEFHDVINLAFVFRLARPVVHTGDAEAVPDNCRALAAHAPEGGILCAPFPWLTVPRSFACVRQYLTPETLFLLHLPNPQRDRWNWGKAVARAVARHSGPPTLACGRHCAPFP